MTLFDCSVHDYGNIIGIDGETETKRRLTDMGLMGAEYLVRAKTRRAILIDADGISLVVRRDIAAKITVHKKGSHENRALRKSKRRQNDAV